jgi:hypothetical protein
MKQAKFQWMQNLTQINGDDLNVKLHGTQDEINIVAGRLYS